VLMLVEVFK